MRQYLGQIRSNVVKKNKETGISIQFFSYFAWGIYLKARNSGYRKFSQKLKAKLDKNTIFEGTKMAKSDYLRYFY